MLIQNINFGPYDYDQIKYMNVDVYRQKFNKLKNSNFTMLQSYLVIFQTKYIFRHFGMFLM